MFNWLTKIILSVAVFLGISSPAVLLTPIVDITPTPTAIVTTPATIKLPSEIIKSPVPTSTPTPSPTPTTKPVRADILLLERLLANPTPEEFKRLCTEGVGILTSIYKTEEVLSNDRLSVIKVRKYLNLAELMPCQALSLGFGVYGRTEAIEHVSVSLLDSDSDGVRLEKLAYNYHLSTLMEKDGISLVLLALVKSGAAPFNKQINIYFPEKKARVLLQNYLVNEMEWTEGGYKQTVLYKPDYFWNLMLAEQLNKIPLAQ